ncbi:hypothetical protein MA13_contig00001-0094 [Edwardsiella piscicida]|nr:hypothetical protein MA13_contig00001-0094 [Edwardsiella piscicida]
MLWAESDGGAPSGCSPAIRWAVHTATSRHTSAKKTLPPDYAARDPLPLSPTVILPFRRYFTIIIPGSRRGIARIVIRSQKGHGIDLSR